MSLTKSIRALPWREFNAAVLACNDEKELTRQLNGMKRIKPLPVTRILRIHMRINKLRAAREREEILALGKPKTTEKETTNESA